MQDMNINYLLVLAGILAIIAELVLGVATGFDLLILGGIAILSGGVGYFFDSTSISLVTIAVLSFAYIIFGRGIIKKSLVVGTTATNVDALIGKKAMVVKKITAEKAGQVKIEGEIWRAEADFTLDENQQAVVHSVSGVTLQMRK